MKKIFYFFIFFKCLISLYGSYDNFYTYFEKKAKNTGEFLNSDFSFKVRYIKNSEYGINKGLPVISIGVHAEGIDKEDYFVQITQTNSEEQKYREFVSFTEEIEPFQVKNTEFFYAPVINSNEKSKISSWLSNVYYVSEKKGYIRVLQWGFANQSFFFFSPKMIEPRVLDEKEKQKDLSLLDTILVNRVPKK